jgi:hypothetical protein
MMMTMPLHFCNQRINLNIFNLWVHKLNFVTTMWLLQAISIIEDFNAYPKRPRADDPFGWLRLYMNTLYANTPTIYHVLTLWAAYG